MTPTKIALYILLYCLLTVAFLLVITAVIILAVTIKIGSLMLADKILYPIIILGDFLQTLDVIELLNILIFAIIGMGFGLGTGFLPKQHGRQISAALLIITVPLILIITPLFRYDRWLEELGNNEKMNPAITRNYADNFFKKKVGFADFFGYYLYTAKFPILPTNKAQLNTLEKVDKKINSQVVQYSGIPPTLVSWATTISTWLLRLFYIAIAITATVSHFHSGLRIVKR